MKHGRWMALAAAILGWMFDGVEIGLFPPIARPALTELITAVTPIDASVATGERTKLIKQKADRWIGVMTAGFLIGAAAGGVVFGWLGDRLGRVRAMTLSVFTYAIFSGLCGFVPNPWSLFACRFVASLGMGGEWSLGVSLVMEIWPNKSRAGLAGLIGAAANVGFVGIACLRLVLTQFLESAGRGLANIGLAPESVSFLTGNSGWRLLMICGALPALLTFFIRIFVPESERWENEKKQGKTAGWSAHDLLAVLLGVCGPLGMVWLWTTDLPVAVKLTGTISGLGLALWGFTYPIRQFLKRTETAVADGPKSNALPRMLLGAGLSGVALLGTWASVQNLSPWADKLVEVETTRLQNEATAAGRDPALVTVPVSRADAAAYTQVASGMGAIFGTIFAAFLGDRLGRRWSYACLCLGSLAAAWYTFQSWGAFDSGFLIRAFFTGGITASFYGWLPLYLPELFPTRIRAFGQGFAFNFGRILAAVGATLFSYLMQQNHGDFALTCRMLSLIYLAGLVVIPFAPETRGKELPQ